MADVKTDLEPQNTKTLVTEGTRAFYIRDYNNAIQSLSKAIELLVAEHGEKHDSLGEVYLNYGKSLLELSREEADPLGDAVPRELKTGDSDTTDEDDGDDGEKAEAAETAEIGKEQDKPEEAKTNGKEVGEENEESDEKEKVDDASIDKDAPGPSGSSGKDEEKGEDITGEEGLFKFIFAICTVSQNY